MMIEEDTIVAIATAPGPAGIAIVRISGTQAFFLADVVFRCEPPKPSERMANTFVYGHVIDKEKQPIDEGIALFFRSPHSYTGEDVVELQVHGGGFSASRTLRRCVEAGARLAQAGEFTKRAFLNGKIDLMQAEAVSDLIHAQTERASKAAFEQLEGGLSKVFNEIYDHLIFLASDIESTLDFPEDELPETVLPEIKKRLETCLMTMNHEMATWDEGHFLRDGALVVISGKPNVGKSTLMNALLNHDRAIVSNVPGTTRDTVEETLILEGIPLRLVDTAGIRDTTCEVEQQGIMRTVKLRHAADFHIYLLDASQPLDKQTLDDIHSLPEDKRLLVFNKMDLAKTLPGEWNAISAQLNEAKGLNEIKEGLKRCLSTRMDLDARPHAVINERHRSLLEKARTSVEKVIQILSSEDEALLFAAAALMKEALEQLGTALGKTYHEELLDQIFSRFCIGK